MAKFPVIRAKQNIAAPKLTEDLLLRLLFGLPAAAAGRDARSAMRFAALDSLDRTERAHGPGRLMRAAL